MAPATLRRKRFLLAILCALLPVAGEAGDVARRRGHKGSGGRDKSIFRRVRRRFLRSTVNLMAIHATRLNVYLLTDHFLELRQRGRLDVARVREDVRELRSLILLRKLKAGFAARRGDGVTVRADHRTRAAKELLAVTFRAGRMIRIVADVWLRERGDEMARGAILKMPFSRV